MYTLKLTTHTGESFNYSHYTTKELAEEAAQNLMESGDYNEYKVTESGPNVHHEYKGYQLCSYKDYDSKGFPIEEFALCKDGDVLLKFGHGRDVDHYRSHFEITVDDYSQEEALSDADKDYPQTLAGFQELTGRDQQPRMKNGERLRWGTRPNPLLGKKQRVWYIEHDFKGRMGTITNNEELAKRYGGEKMKESELEEGLFDKFKASFLQGAKEQAVEQLKPEFRDKYYSGIQKAESYKEIMKILAKAHKEDGAVISESKTINESFVDDAGTAELDYEVQMARQELYHIAQDAISLHRALKTHDDIEAWAGSRISEVKALLNTVQEYVTGREMPMMDPVVEPIQEPMDEPMPDIEPQFVTQEELLQIKKHKVDEHEDYESYVNPLKARGYKIKVDDKGDRWTFHVSKDGESFTVTEPTSGEYYLSGDEKKYSSLKAAIDGHMVAIGEAKIFEGYYKMPPIDKDRYQKREGLEGPFGTTSGKVLYYDPSAGKWYDSDSDMYLTYDEYMAYNPDPTLEESRLKISDIQRWIKARRMEGWSVYKSRVNHRGEKSQMLEFRKDGHEFWITGRDNVWDLFFHSTWDGRGSATFDNLDDAFVAGTKGVSENTAGAVAGVAMPLGSSKKKKKMFGEGDDDKRARAERMLKNLIDEYNGIMAGMSDADEHEVSKKIEQLVDKFDFDIDMYLDQE